MMRFFGNALYMQFSTVRVLTINFINMKKEELKKLIESEENGKDWFNSYQEIDNFLFDKLEELNIDFPLVDYNDLPEINTIEAIKLLCEARVSMYKDSIV